MNHLTKIEQLEYLIPFLKEQIMYYQLDLDKAEIELESLKMKEKTLKLERKDDK